MGESSTSEKKNKRAFINNEDYFTKVEKNQESNFKNSHSETTSERNNKNLNIDNFTNSNFENKIDSRIKNNSKIIIELFNEKLENFKYQIFKTENFEKFSNKLFEQLQVSIIDLTDKLNENVKELSGYDAHVQPFQNKLIITVKNVPKTVDEEQQIKMFG